MEKLAVNFKAVQGASPVDKILWEQHLAQISRWVMEECLEKARSETITPVTFDKDAHKNTTIDRYEQKN